MNNISMKLGTIAGGALLIAGSLMTWVSVDLGFRAFSASGTDTTEGKLTLAAGLVLVGLGLAALTHRATGRATTYLAAGAAVFGSVVLFLEYLDVVERIAQAEGTPATAVVGSGVWIAAVGAVVALAAAAWSVVSKART